MMSHSELLKVALERGEPLDACLAVLGQQGASVIDLIKAVREVKGLSLKDAKRLVEESAYWERSSDSR
jgi:ribosomal protein L7/L12